MSLVDLSGKKGVVFGIANEASIAYGCARVLSGAGAELAVTYLNEKAEPHVRPLAETLNCPLILPCDVTVSGQMETVFREIEATWGTLDFLLHSMAFAPRDDLQGRVVDCSREGFGLAMDVSCHSFIRMAKLAEPLMENGGCLVTMSYLGSEKVIKDYNLMGPVKAALESVTRYLAAELGPRGIRVNSISPGPLKTRAASGIAHFDKLMEDAAARSPERKLVTIDDVGALTAFLVSDAARSITGNNTYIDAGLHIVGL